MLGKACKKVLGKGQAKSLLVRKPYDCWHAGISLRLYAGVPPTKVAEWAGHSVEVLLRIYAHCLDGDDDRWHGQIDDAVSQRNSGQGVPDCAAVAQEPATVLYRSPVSGACGR